MRKYNISNGVVETYDNIEDIIKVLEGINPTLLTYARRSHYINDNDNEDNALVIKEMAVFTIPRRRKSLLTLCHDGNTGRDYYYSCFPDYAPPHGKFGEYYELVRNDDHMECALKKLKIGERVYYVHNGDIDAGDVTRLFCDINGCTRARIDATIRLDRTGAYTIGLLAHNCTTICFDENYLHVSCSARIYNDFGDAKQFALQQISGEILRLKGLIQIEKRQYCSIKNMEDRHD